MASKENPGDSPRQPLKQDSLVERLIPDPSNPQATIQLVGWLGKGTEATSWHLYLTPKLDEYVQFSDKDVVHTQPLPEEQSPLGGTIVWLRPDATLQYIQVIARQAQADFLSGGITSAFMAGAASSFPSPLSRRPAAVVGTAGVNCSANPHIPACRPQTANCYPTKIGCTIDPIYCGSHGAFCQTREFVCGYSVGCTQHQECSVGC